VNGPNPRIPAIAVLAGVAVAAALVITSSLKYPAISRLPGASVFLALSVAALLGYAACGAWALRHPFAGQRTGLAWGALGAAMWSAEIWARGPAKLSYSAEQATGLTFALLAVAATAAAAYSPRRRSVPPGPPGRQDCSAGWSVASSSTPSG